MTCPIALIAPARGAVIKSYVKIYSVEIDEPVCLFSPTWVNKDRSGIANGERFICYMYDPISDFIMPESSTLSM